MIFICFSEKHKLLAQTFSKKSFFPFAIFSRIFQMHWRNPSQFDVFFYWRSVYLVCNGICWKKCKFNGYMIYNYNWFLLYKFINCCYYCIAEIIDWIFPEDCFNFFENGQISRKLFSSTKQNFVFKAFWNL